ncbi:hypothetical protein [Nostoc sp.]|uniref:hypothetical protein n=1 Tax=Nostoc sp. TaxID=1180 RepID=UPI002FF4564F
MAQVLGLEALPKDETDVKQELGLTQKNLKILFLRVAPVASPKGDAARSKIPVGVQVGEPQGRTGFSASSVVRFSVTCA